MADAKFFSTFWDAFFVLFIAMTGDWAEVARDVANKENWDLGAKGEDKYFDKFYIEMYFVSFVLLTSFLIVNVAIAVLLENMFIAHDEMEIEDADTYYASVTVHCCKNLPSMDVSGASDPYVEVKFIYAGDSLTGHRHPDEVFNTAVCHDELNPYWDSKFTCVGKPKSVELAVCEKDFGLKSKAMKIGRSISSALGVQRIFGGTRTNERGDEVVGLQARSFARLFDILDNDMLENPTRSPLQEESLEFPSRYSKGSVAAARKPSRSATMYITPQEGR